MTDNLEEDAGEAVDLEEAEDAAAKDVVAEREAALAKQLEEMRKRKKRLVDPLQYEMSILAEDLTGYVPAFGYQAAPPSQKQLALLEKYGIDPDGVENAGKASLLIDRLIARQKEGLATPRQIRLLERYGFEHVGTWQFDDASRLISCIAGNGWQVPRWITIKGYTPGEEAG